MLHGKQIAWLIDFPDGTVISQTGEGAWLTMQQELIDNGEKKCFEKCYFFLDFVERSFLNALFVVGNVFGHAYWIPETCQTSSGHIFCVVVQLVPHFLLPACRIQRWSFLMDYHVISMKFIDSFIPIRGKRQPRRLTTRTRQFLRSDIADCSGQIQKLKCVCKSWPTSKIWNQC